MKIYRLIAAILIALAPACGQQVEMNQLEIDREDVVSVDLQEDGNFVRITLTDAASTRLESVTSECIGETLSLVIAGDVVSESVVQEAIAGPSLVVACPDGETAEGIFEELSR